MTTKEIPTLDRPSRSLSDHDGDVEPRTPLDPSSDYDPDASLSESERAQMDRRLVRRLDMKLIPWLTLLYLVSFLDRTNIGNARIDGLTTDLGISSGQYNAALSLFFVSYAAFEPLTNILLKRLRPSVFIPSIIILWGICMLSMGFVTSFSGLAAARFFLGVAESGLFPGVNFFLSCYYRRNEIGVRIALFFSAAAIAGSFGGLLAAALALIKVGDGRFAQGWRWIFIIEGLATAVIGVVSFWMVHDFPESATFLSDDDRARVIRRLKADQQSSAEHEGFQMSYFWSSVRDWKTWAFAVIYVGCDMPLYAFSLFLPTIISQLGDIARSPTRANLLSVPPYAAAAILTVAVGYLADRTRQRAWFNASTTMIGLAGFGMLIGSQVPGVKYAGTFLAALGVYPCIANTIVWAANNTEGVYKRGVTLGFVIGIGNISGVISSNIFLAREKPRYYSGYGVILGFMFVFLFCGSVLTRFLLAAENKKRLAGKRDGWIAGKTPKEVLQLGDKRPDFLYTL